MWKYNSHKCFAMFETERKIKFLKNFFLCTSPPSVKPHENVWAKQNSSELFRHFFHVWNRIKKHFWTKKNKKIFFRWWNQDHFFFLLSGQSSNSIVKAGHFCRVQRLTTEPESKFNHSTIWCTWKVFSDCRSTFVAAELVLLLQVAVVMPCLWRTCSACFNTAS